MSASTRRFENWLMAYIEYTKHSEASSSMHFWTGVSTIAGALRRRVWIDQRSFQWTPNFYVIFVAPPGIATKSTTILSGMHLLEQVDGIHFGPNSLTWQGLTESLAAAADVLEYGDKLLPMSCLTIPVSELGTFLKPKDTDLVDVLVDLWDGQLRPWRHKTKTQGETTIINPWMNIIGCTTPAWLRANFPMYMVEGGLTSRCIFVYADSKKQFVPYPADLISGEEHRAFQLNLLEDLKVMAEMKGEYRLTAGAHQWGSAWYERHWRAVKDNTASERLSGYLARKQTHIHKLAIVMAAAKRNELYIDETDLQAAESIITALENDLTQVFKTIGATESSRQITDITIMLESGNGMLSVQELTKLALQRMDYRQFAVAIEGMKTANIIIPAIVDGAMGYKLVSYEPKAPSLEGIVG